ncbi:MAG: cytochrome-c oxidase, cbb3-type subunit III [Betaproteobacteria bacterium]
MADFFSEGWSWYVALATVISVLACAVLLWVAGKARVGAKTRADNTTGHVWDEDLREYNNPLPRWWMWLFILTVIFGLIYLALYPGLGAYEGLSKWSQQAQHEVDARQMRESLAPLYAKFSAKSVAELAKDPQALAIGQRHFMNYCSQCHGSDGRGGKGFPNLTQGAAGWLGPLSVEHIVQTITQGRQGVMPAMGAVLGSQEAVTDVAHYVMSLSGSPHNELKAYSGKKHFAACAACHGNDGKGNKALGAPNLTDNYWLHGWGEEAIANIIKNGKTNVMPSQAAWLSPEQIHAVAAYVLSLSGGDADEAKHAAPAR